MGMLDIIKGAYLISGAVDKTLPIASDQTASDITRGTVVVIEVTGGVSYFRRSEANDHDSNLVPYVCLVDADKTAGMAGSAGADFGGTGNASAFSGLSVVGFGPDGGVGTVGGTVAAGSYVVTAVPLSMVGEFRTTEFTGSPAADDLLSMAANGVLQVAPTGLGTDTIVGKVTKGVTTVYSNHKQVSPTMQGGPVSVIEFVSMFVTK